MVHKLLTDRELAKIVNAIVEGGVIEELAMYNNFLLDLGELLENYLGAECNQLSRPLGNGSGDDDVDRAGVYFAATESTPADGGIFANYDPDITVEEWLNPVQLVTT